MAQVSNACFPLNHGMISIEEMYTKIRETISSIATPHMVSVYDSLGYITAVDIVAQVDIPAYDNSAVDGYAVNSSYIFGKSAPSTEKGHRVSTRITAGMDVAHCDPSQVVRIFTGAAVPNGMDMVFMQEDVQKSSDGLVQFPDDMTKGNNIRKRGEDVQQGAVIIPQGTKIQPVHIALISSQGYSTVSVYEKLKVGFFSSGDELLEVGQDASLLTQGKVFDSNRPMALSLIRSCGMIPVDLGHVRDDLDATRAFLRQSVDKCDVIMSSGGMSVGEEDYIHQVLKEHSLSFWKIAMKPGKPVGFGMIDGTPFLGLPGNPVSVHIVFGLVGLYVLKILSGEKEFTIPKIPVRLGFDIKAKLGRREFMRVVLHNDNGVYYAVKSGKQGSGVISTLANASGIIEVPEQFSALKKGDWVQYIPFSGLYT